MYYVPKLTLDNWAMQEWRIPRTPMTHVTSSMSIDRLALLNDK